MHACMHGMHELTIKRIEKGPHSNAMLSMLRVLAYVDPEIVTKSELKWLCLTECPFKDENHWTAFREDGSHIFTAALSKTHSTVHTYSHSDRRN